MSPKAQARVAGSLYLVVIILGAFAELGVRARLFAPGDPTRTAHNILAHESLYRLGFAVQVFYLACDVPLIFLLYNIFKIVRQKVALLGAIFALIAAAVEAASLLAHYAPNVLLQGSGTLHAFTPAQLDAASYASLQLFEAGFDISLVFFGCDCLALSYLIVKSTFLPRLIGIGLAVEGLGYLINSFSLFLAPDFQARIFPYFAVTGLAEVALALWLLLVGINESRWAEQARTSGFVG